MQTPKSRPFEFLFLACSQIPLIHQSLHAFHSYRLLHPAMFLPTGCLGPNLVSKCTYPSRRSSLSDLSATALAKCFSIHKHTQLSLATLSLQKVLVTYLPLFSMSCLQAEFQPFISCFRFRKTISFRPVYLVLTVLLNNTKGFYGYENLFKKRKTVALRRACVRNTSSVPDKFTVQSNVEVPV